MAGKWRIHFRHFSVIFFCTFPAIHSYLCPKKNYMKTICRISLFVMTLIMSLLPLSLSADDKGASHTVVLQQQPKTTLDHNQQADDEGKRLPSRPVIVYISATDGVYSSYFDSEDVISYSILDGEGQLIFSTDDGSEFIDHLAGCTGVIEIQIELADYILGGWLQL